MAQANEYLGLSHKDESKVDQHVVENGWTKEQKEFLLSQFCHSPKPVLPCVQRNLKGAINAHLIAYYWVNSYMAVSFYRSLGRSVGLLVGLSVCPSKKIWTTSIAPRKLIFGMQLAFNLTRKCFEKKFEIL